MTRAAAPRHPWMLRPPTLRCLPFLGCRVIQISVRAEAAGGERFIRSGQIDANRTPRPSKWPCRREIHQGVRRETPPPPKCARTPLTARTSRLRPATLPQWAGCPAPHRSWPRVTSTSRAPQPRCGTASVSLRCAVTSPSAAPAAAETYGPVLTRGAVCPTDRPAFVSAEMFCMSSAPSPTGESRAGGCSLLDGPALGAWWIRTARR